MNETYIWRIEDSVADCGSEFLNGGSGRCAAGGIVSAIAGPRDDPPSAGISIAGREIWIAVFPPNGISRLGIGDLRHGI